MNRLVNIETIGNVLTMSSLEIAELTGKRHADVLRDIRVMLDELDTERSFALSEYKDPTGRILPCYNLPKRETLILVSGYSTELRARIIDRWQELERAQATVTLPNFNDPVEAARAWANEVEQKQLLQIENQKQNALLIEQAPKVEFHDAVESAVNSTPVSVFAKLINIPGLGQNKLFAWFRDKGYLINGGRRHNTPLQRYVRQGLFEVKEGVYERPDGIVMTTYTTLITGKGQIYFEKKLREEFI